MVYLDNNATSKLDSRVLEQMMPYLTNQYGNPSSISRFSQKAKKAVEAARYQVAKLVSAQPEEIIFTSGGTKANLIV